MPDVIAVINFTIDNKPVPGFPLSRTITTADEVTGQQRYKRASTAGYFDIPIDDIENLILAVLTTDQDITLRMNDQTTTGLPLDKGGLFVAVGTDILSASPAIAVNNLSGTTAKLTSYVAGIHVGGPPPS